MMRLTIAPALMVLLLHSASAWAQSDDAVVVLSHGGVEKVAVYDLSVAQPRTSVPLGERRVVPASVGQVRISDIKILPDGSHLLAGVDGRGAVVTTPDGAAFNWVLDEAQRYSDVDSVAVGSYFGPGEPSLVVTGDSGGSNVVVRSTSREDTVWFDSVRLSVARGYVPQVVVMPENKLAIAVNWPDIGVYGIRLRDASDPFAEGSSILSEAHIESPADAVLVPELDLIRDLTVLQDGRMLVTMRYAIAILAPTGELDELINIGSFPEISGELASVRVLPSGLWVIATFQPGEWIRPHTNHRVHWYDPATAAVVASSEPLSRAPLRVEPQRGNGGTGTVGFNAGLDLIQQGDPATLELVSLVLPGSTPVGGRLASRATLRNTGTLPVGLVTVAIRGQRGACGGALQPEFDFATATSVALNPAQEFTWMGDQALDATFTVGQWCAFVQGTDLQGATHTFGAPIGFEIGEATSATGTTIEVVPLPFGEGPAQDMGFDASDASGGVAEPPVDEGCCATASPRPAHPPWWLLFGVVALSARPWARGRGRR